MTATIPELAARAANKIRRDGWLQKELYEYVLVGEDHDEVVPVENCAVCLLGACALAYWDDYGEAYNRRDDQYALFLEAVAAEVYARAEVDNYGPLTMITVYNDEVARSVDDVLAVLDAVAAG